MSNKCKPLLLLVCAAVFTATSASAAEKIVPNGGETFNAIVSITTGLDGTATYITIPPPEKGKPLLAGFRIEYGTPTPSPIYFTGEARVVFSEEQPAHRPLALSVKTSEGKCWMFKAEVFGGEVAPGCEVVEEISGIAHFWWSASAEGFPRTHDEFVRQREELASQRVGLPLDSCGCSGGCGASQCSCGSQGGGSCSVTCQAGKNACCSNAGDCHCMPACLMPAVSLLTPAKAPASCDKGQLTK